MTGEPQLDAGVCVYRVVNAAVAGHKAAKQRAVGGVDDGVRRQRRDIALPEADAVPRRRSQFISRYGAPGRQFFLKIGVLYRQQSFAGGPRRAQIEERAKQPLFSSVSAGTFKPAYFGSSAAKAQIR